MIDFDHEDHRDVGPVQAWTNIAYVIMGFLAMLYADGNLDFFAGAALSMLGVASGVFHYSGLYPAQKADEIGIYLVLLATLASLVNWFPALLITLVILLAGYTAVYHRRFSSFKTGFALGSLNLILAAFINWQLTLVIFGLFLIGVLASWLGRKHTKYNDWLHGVWHVFTSIALRLLILV